MQNGELLFQQKISINTMHVCFFGTYDKSYSSNKIILDGLKENNVTILEIHNEVKISRLNKQQDLGIIALLKRLFVKFSLIPLSLKHFKEIKKCDVLFVGYPGHIDLLIAYFIAKLTNTKLVFYPLIILYITFTEDVNLFKKSSLLAKILFVFEKFLYSLPDMIVADIPYQKKFFIEKFGIPAKKLREIPIGADDKIYKYKKTIKNDNKLKAVYYGLYSPLHGVEHLIEAAKLLRNEKDIQFVMVGNGQTFEENYKRAMQYKLTNVSFLSEMTEKDSLATLQQADVFFGLVQNSPSVFRVLPNKVYQGLALGKTVLTADSPASRGVFIDKENIYLCKPADPQSIADALKDLKNNPTLRNTIAKNAYKKYVSEFTPKAIGKKLLNIFKDTTN